MSRVSVLSSCSGRLLTCALLLMTLLSSTHHCALLSSASSATAHAASASTSTATATSTNTWVVLVSTSRYWFNYRHTANALSMYRIVKAAGVPDSNILLLLPDDYACQPRNGPHAASMFNSADHLFNLYSDDDVEVDYRGSAVTVESLLRLLTGRHSPHTAKRQRLLSDERSNVLLYMSGHGGNEFLKFQDAEELSATDIGLALQTMYGQRRFSRLLMVSDTCQAESLHRHIDAPGVLSVAASRVGENSYSSSLDPAVGLSLIDRFTDSMLDFFERRHSLHHSKLNSSSGGSGSGGGHHWMSRVSVGDLVSSLDPNRLLSHPVTRTDLFPLPLARTPLTSFFAADHHSHHSSSRTDTYPQLGELLSFDQLNEQSARSVPPLPSVTSTAAAPRSPLPISVQSLLRLTLPSVSAVDLHARLESTRRSQLLRTQSTAVWPALAAAVCVAVPLLCWLLEQSSHEGRKPLPTLQHSPVN